MTKFENGPAADTTLCLARVPLFLRVAVADNGEVDALDQLDDEAKADETLYAYRKVSDDGTVHVDGRDRQGRRFGRWYVCATYALCEHQPDQATMLDVAAWREWTRKQVRP